MEPCAAAEKRAIAGSGITGEAPLEENHEGRVRIKLKLQGSPDSKLTPGLYETHAQRGGMILAATLSKRVFLKSPRE
jgi:hypothetical protein